MIFANFRMFAWLLPFHLLLLWFFWTCSSSGSCIFWFRKISYNFHETFDQMMAITATKIHTIFIRQIEWMIQTIYKIQGIQARPMAVFWANLVQKFLQLFHLHTVELTLISPAARNRKRQRRHQFPRRGFDNRSMTLREGLSTKRLEMQQSCSPLSEFDTWQVQIYFEL